MKNIKIFALLAALMLPVAANAQHQYVVNAKKLGAPVQPTMYGIFFEDINFGADGGLYAELIENRSFEFPQQLMGWNIFGNVAVRDVNPAFERNPHYVTLSDPGHHDKFTGVENHGFFGIGLKSGMDYLFSVFARSGGKSRIRVELVDADNNPIAKQSIDVSGGEWKKYTATLRSPKTDAKGFLRIFLESPASVDLDHVSLFPADNWNGLRRDLVNDLKDLHPGVFRFPGGCIVEGTTLAERYQWKNTVGPAENRPLNHTDCSRTISKAVDSASTSSSCSPKRLEHRLCQWSVSVWHASIRIATTRLMWCMCLSISCSHTSTMPST